MPASTNNRTILISQMSLEVSDNELKKLVEPSWVYEDAEFDWGQDTFLTYSISSEPLVLTPIEDVSVN
jgi:hypothetical protein